MKGMLWLGGLEYVVELVLSECIQVYMGMDSILGIVLVWLGSVVVWFDSMEGIDPSGM